MVDKTRLTTKIERIVYIGLLLSCLLLLTPALASGYANFQTKFMGEIRTVYTTMLNVARVCAAVSVAFGGLKLLLANGEKNAYEQKIEKAKYQIFYSILALAALYMIPAAVQWGVDIGKTVRWNPDPSTW